MTLRAVTVRAAIAVALGWFLALTALPPPRGLVPGLTSTYDPDLGHLLWPWLWGQADARLLLIVPIVLAGALVVAAPRWAPVAAALPVLVEGWQFLVPGLGEVAAARDVAHAWIALAVGVLVGSGVRLAGRFGARLVQATSGATSRSGLTSRPRHTLVTVGLVATVLLGTSTVWPQADGEAVAAVPATGVAGPLHGGEFHGGDTPDAAARHWIGAGHVPGEGTAYEEMSRVALWDLFLLTRDALPPAGPAAQWDYFWPRDGAFVAVALLQSGHLADAVEILERQSQLYLDPLYGFDARYLLDGQRVTADPRGAQVDGCGWLLWSIHEVSQAVAVPEDVARLRDRCTDQILRATGGGSRLAAASPDYWERATFDRLLGANAPLVLGLRSAAADYTAAGDGARAEVVASAARALRQQVADDFGPSFERTTRGGGLDAATAMLMPPFDPDPLVGVREAWRGYQDGAARPGGGLAPGTAWKQDGLSWTPEVALVAYTAAADGQVDLARGWLDWLDAHRTPWGSLPEKVGPGGEPGGPAPLGWTSALVLLTLAELE